MREVKFEIAVCGFVVFICFFFIGYGYIEKGITKKANEEAKVRVEECIDDGYSVYYNGTRVDGNNVYVLDYKYIIDEEKKSIYLTDKRVRAVWFPFMAY